MNLWILVQHRDGLIEEETYGLLGEARRLLSGQGGPGTITAVVLADRATDSLKALGSYGADRVLCVEGPSLGHYQGEWFASVLWKLAGEEIPSIVLASHSSQTADLCPRLAALLETGLITRAVDFDITQEGKARAVRPVANGYLFEELHFDCQGPPIVTFLPSVLSTPDPDHSARAQILIRIPGVPGDHPKVKLLERRESAPETLEMEEADIVVAGGRGAGKGEDFEIIHELARLLGGSVGGTRPVIDARTLPFDRQIGQTGKTITPRLMVACGISGANEFTAGMERSHLVVAVNSDPRARIFRFADLGVVGDLREILPLLVSRLRELKER